MPNDSISLLPIPFQYRFVVRFLFKTEFPLSVQPIKNHAHNAPYVDIKNNQTRAFDIQALQSMEKTLFPRAHLLIFFQFAETHFGFRLGTVKTEPSVHREPAKGGKAFIIQRIPFAFSPSSEIYFLLKRTLCNFCPMPRINGRQRFDAAYADQTACISAGKCKVFHPFQFTPQKVNRLLCS